MRTIKVTVDENGELEAETKGMPGSDCLKETLELERALGKKTSDKHTAEMFTKKKTNDAKH